MKTITIRQLHLETGRWVRHAAATRQSIVVTDRGRRVAALQPFTPPVAKALPDREARIRRRSRIPVDSAVYQSEMRDRG